MSSKRTDAFPTLATRRLRLRRFEPRDAQGLHACFGDPDAMAYWNFPACTTLADTAKSLAWLGKITSPYDHLAWAVAAKASDQCIGMVNYHHRDARNRRLELGYIIAPKHQRKGLGREAVRAVLDHCVEELGAHRIEALIHPDNVASRRLVERLGFRCEGGPLIDYWKVGNRYLSVMVYAYISGAR
jgi:[ribosomal protein S5]-alanine N-acetyltransferase